MKQANKKIFILLPDGVGLRTFAYSKFYEICGNRGLDIVFWNRTVFPLSELGFKEIKIEKSRVNPLSDILKNVRKHLELTLFTRKKKDSVYDAYRFNFTYSPLKRAGKSIAAKILIATHNSEKGLAKIRKRIKQLESDTDYFRESFATLEREKPGFVFCTNQRSLTAVAPILAAQRLGIPTATFIFSWDNLPKATMVVETDYYFVWSELMKLQLLDYYPYIAPEQVFITGTPQFESHFDPSIILSRNDFFAEHGLQMDKKYICFSGDDVVTSPDDPRFLEDAAKAIIDLNKNGHNLGIVFRRCPVDFSGRYDPIIAKYNEIIRPIEPRWKSLNRSWDSVLPTPEDITLLVNTIAHTEMVVNLGSSMVFDYVTFDKPCGYFNYNQNPSLDPKWDIHKCYNYVHFRSMPSPGAVVWFNSPNEIAAHIEAVLSDSTSVVANAHRWFEKINLHPPYQASNRIVEALLQILVEEGKS